MRTSDLLRHATDLEKLVALFHADPAELGQFEPVRPADLPPLQRQLLAHHQHMTETMESFHRTRVDVQVITTRANATHYAREILLRRRTDKVVVQFGIMRIAFSAIDDEIRAAIESEAIPLGTILIEHDVLRQVQLSCLWRVSPGRRLRQLLGAGDDEVIYGRTAIIKLNGSPAVELLEITAPAAAPGQSEEAAADGES